MVKLPPKPKPIQDFYSSGIVHKKNIDLTKIKPVKNGNDWSTILSTSFGTDLGEVLLPTVVEGKIVSPEEAFKYYQKTGKHLGIYKDAKTAEAAARFYHNQEALRLAILQAMGKLQ